MAKGIYIGTLKMGSMYVGGKKVTAVYVGSTKIYPTAVAIANVSVNLNSQWQRYSGTAISGYTVYQSAKNRGVNSSFDTMKLTFNGNYDVYEFYICSDGEANYDYTWVSQLNASQPTSNSVPSDALATHKTVNSITGGTYTKVTLSNVKSGDYLWVTYRKDGSVNGATDRGYVLLPTGTTTIASVTNEYKEAAVVVYHTLTLDMSNCDIQIEYNDFSDVTSDDTFSIPDGAVVTITVIPSEGYEFTGWGGSLTKTFTMDSDKSFSIICTKKASESVSLYLDGNWQRSSIAVSGYKVFESIDISGSQTSRFLPCRISWSGISDFKFGIWSDSEASSSTALSSSNYYDYTVAFKVGITPELADAKDDTKIQKHTKGIGNGKGSPADNLSTIQSGYMADYSGQSSGIARVAYKTDGSQTYGADKGYILIPDKYNVYVY